MLLATGNSGKVQEFQQLLHGLPFRLYLPSEMNIAFDVEETGNTFHENALLKAKAIQSGLTDTSIPILSDDSGLEVSALGGKPGIYTARYAGIGASSAQNREKLLQALNDVSNRRARFVCVLCYLREGEQQYFEGSCEGQIAETESGDGGFGYDSIFIPNGQTLTFAQLDSETKGRLSHRGLAVAKLEKFLNASFP